MSVRFGLSFAVDLYYRVLRGIDLGSDASSLFDGHLRPWSRELARWYPRGAPLADRLQVAALVVPDLEALVRGLRAMASPVGPLLAEVLDLEEPLARMDWDRRANLRAARAESVAAMLGPELEVVRAELWRRIEQAPPSALVIDAPIPRCGRAASLAGQRVIAASFDDPLDALLSQIVHEDTHAVSDRAVLASWAGGARSTRPGHPGFGLHEALEAQALELGGEIVSAALPHRAAAYAAWRRRREGSRSGSAR